MKASLITIVDNVNFGTYLQAFATVLKLKECGVDVQVINYKRPYITKKVLYKNYLSNESWSLLKKLVYISGTFVLESYMRYNLKRFLTSRVVMSRTCSSPKNILKVIADSDILVTGSDQVWNAIHNHGVDKAFFWYNSPKPKFSYASSFGMTDFSNSLKLEIKNLLSSYKGISVRENDGVSFLNSIGIDDVEHVLDPTLLLDKNEWIRHSKSRFVKTEPYLLIYSVESTRNTLVKEQAKIIAAEKGLKIYVVSPGIKLPNEFKADRIFNLSTVDDFIKLFFEADFVVVSSFHGTAFSINFNKEFITVSSGRFNSRINSLLSLTKLEQRFVTTKCKSSHDINMIDYSIVNDIIFNERRKSESYLSRMTMSE